MHSKAKNILQTLIANAESFGARRVGELINNASLIRTQFLKEILDDRRDIDEECGYPKNITPQQYRFLYNREGIAHRLVNLWPDESWAIPPNIFESEEAEETEFERRWKELDQKHHLLHHLHLADRLSGIGRYGVLLLGINDGKPLEEPVDGIDLKTGEATSVGAGQRELIYVRVFDESVAVIDSREGDKTSPRYGQPVLYSLTVKDVHEVGEVESEHTLKVHWTRVIHIAENRQTSVIHGTPRLEIGYNPIYDIRKVRSGSGEMFWKGAFPGYALQTAPEIGSLTDDEITSIKSQWEDYSNGLQRILAFAGVTVNSLAPQVADPRPHMEALIEYLAITYNIPKRKLIGSEQAQLASEQDTRTWNGRVSRRNESYVTPMIIRPFVDRLQAIAVLPETESYEVDWPDLNTVTDMEKADVALKRTEALAKYVAGGVEALVPPPEYMTIILEMDQEEVDKINKAADEYQDILDEQDEEEFQKGLERQKVRMEELGQQDSEGPGSGPPGVSQGPQNRNEE